MFPLFKHKENVCCNKKKRRRRRIREKWREKKTYRKRHKSVWKVRVRNEDVSYRLDWLRADNRNFANKLNWKPMKSTPRRWSWSWSWSDEHFRLRLLPILPMHMPKAESRRTKDKMRHNLSIVNVSNWLLLLSVINLVRSLASIVKSFFQRSVVVFV